MSAESRPENDGRQWLVTGLDLLLSCREIYSPSAGVAESEAIRETKEPLPPAQSAVGHPLTYDQSQGLPEDVGLRLMPSNAVASQEKDRGCSFVHERKVRVRIWPARHLDSRLVNESISCA